MTTSPLNGNVKCGTIVDARTHALMMGVRQLLIMALGLVEDYIGVERSIVPRRKRV